MVTSSVSETKTHLSALLELVKHGDTVIITERGVPIARLEALAIRGEKGDSTARLDRLQRAGLVRRGSGKLVGDIWKNAGPAPKKGGDILQALLADREEGR